MEGNRRRLFRLNMQALFSKAVNIPSPTGHNRVWRGGDAPSLSSPREGWTLRS
jgi:hypothetical protein